MKRDVKEIIRRNREVLGMYGSTRIDEIVVDSLELANKMVSLETMIKSNQNRGTEYILADGLIVGYVS